jgi:hypothetical protein
MGNINYNKIYREALRKAAIELEERSIEFQRRLEDQVVNLGVISSSMAGRNSDVTSKHNFRLNFDGVDDKVTILHSASIDNLPLNDFTVDFSVNHANIIETYHSILTKETELGSWQISFSNQSGLWIEFAIYTSTNDFLYYDFLSEITNSSGHHHYELSWNSTTKNVKVFEDGVPLSSEDFGFEPAEYLDDSSGSLLMGEGGLLLGGSHLDGAISWLRISNIVRHTSGFAPPSLIVCPASDANTILRLALDEGNGTLAHDTSGNDNDGIISGATWELDTLDELNTFESTAFDSESFE